VHIWAARQLLLLPSGAGVAPAGGGQLLPTFYPDSLVALEERWGSLPVQPAF
jgi:hypothetical protein